MEEDTVRRCQRCKAPAVIVVHRWDSRLFGLLPTGTGRTDHRCQSCGARFTLRPHLLLWFFFGSVMGVQYTVVAVTATVGTFVALVVQGPAVALLVGFIAVMYIGVGGAIIRVLVAPQVRAWRNPIVPGAAMPKQRLGPPENLRLCTCGRPAACIRQTEFTVNILSAGTDSTYLCGVCGRQFNVPDALSLAFNVGTTAFLGTIGLGLASLLPFEELSGDNIFCLAVLGLGALLGAFLAAVGLFQRHRHPRA